nr:jasmonate O-methyltransferase-like isoform X2 [Coffea arabica]
MDTLQILRMNGGEGETSYAKNSVVQRKIMSYESPSIEEAVTDILCKNFSETMGMADLGCSSGPNTLTLVSEVIDMVNSKSQKMGFSLPEKQEEEKGKGFRNNCFISCVGGSFYGRLFPKKSLHLVHSSSSLHWLSRAPPRLAVDAAVPLNKGKIYISKTSPSSVSKAYLSQFREDLSLFLKSRSEEMVPGGRMVLSFLGRTSADPATEHGGHQWELLAKALTSMVSEGRVLEEKIDSFNAPYYAPSLEEVRNEVEEEGSFVIKSLKALEVEWDAGFQTDSACEIQENKRKISSRGGRVAKTIRAVVESMLESQFGRDIIDDLFVKYAELVDDYFSRTTPIYINLVLSVTRKGP